MGFYLKVKSNTWLRDSHNLYDFDSPNTVQEALKITESGSLIRKANDISFVSEPSSPPDGQLLNIHKNNETFFIYPLKEQPMGMVIKDMNFLNAKGFTLSYGDVIKLGKVILKVKETHNSLRPEPEEIDECEGSNASDVTCRICFRTHTNMIDPLLSLCSCSGTMALTHYRCLQKWVMMKCTKKINPFSLTYSWKEIACDICKKEIPMKFRYEKREYNLVSIPKPSGNFLILEDSRRDKFKCIVHVLTPQIPPLAIGRSSECDLKINDISVSRSHAIIEMEDNRFYIRDNFSKFGTVIMQSKPFSFKNQSCVTLQINRTLLNITLKKHSGLNNCLKCCRSNKVTAEPIHRGRTEVPYEEQSLQSVISGFDN